MSSNQYRYRNRGGTRVNQHSKRWLSLQLFLSLLCIGLIAAWLYLPINSSQVEQIYSQTIYPFVSNYLVPLNSIVPFPLTLICLLVFIIVAVINLMRAIIYGGFWRWLLGFILAISLISVWFFVAWGANYQRLTVTEMLDLDIGLDASQAAAQEQDLIELADYLLNVIERDVGEARAHPEAIQDAIQAVSESLTKFLNQQAIHAPTISKSVKFWPKGTLLRTFSASGVMLPWFIEPTVDAGLADADLVAVAAHELAHAGGFATEGDADFIGTVVALSADNAFSRYSAALRSYQKISRDLSKDKKAELDLRLPSLAKKDWNDTYNAYMQYQAPDWLKQSNQSIYDSYLQSQGIEEGIKDYARSTNLLLQAMQKGLLP